MKHFMIRYEFKNGTTEAWHQEIGRFIKAIDGDPELKGRIGYRVLKNRDDGSYFHLASVSDDAAQKTLQSRDFFKAYQEMLTAVSDLDAVAICTPPGPRRVIAADCLAAGKHVLLEKPPAGTVTEVPAIARGGRGEEGGVHDLSRPAQPGRQAGR